MVLLNINTDPGMRVSPANQHRHHPPDWRHYRTRKTKTNKATLTISSSMGYTYTLHGRIEAGYMIDILCTGKSFLQRSRNRLLSQNAMAIPDPHIPALRCAAISITTWNPHFSSFFADSAGLDTVALGQSYCDRAVISTMELDEIVAL